MLVAGSIGPVGKLLEPYGTLSLEEVREAFSEQAAALKDSGVDVIFVETMADLQEAGAAVEAAKSTGLPVVAQMSFAQEGRTMMGVDPATAVQTFCELGADVVGANCGTGFYDMLSVVREIISATDRPVIAQTNAGFPQMVDGRLVYMGSPAWLIVQSSLQSWELQSSVGAAELHRPHPAISRRCGDNYGADRPVRTSITTVEIDLLERCNRKRSAKRRSLEVSMPSILLTVRLASHGVGCSCPLAQGGWARYVLHMTQR